MLDQNVKERSNERCFVVVWEDRIEIWNLVLLFYEMEMLKRRWNSYADMSRIDRSHVSFAIFIEIDRESLETVIILFLRVFRYLSSLILTFCILSCTCFKTGWIFSCRRYASRLNILCTRWIEQCEWNWYFFLFKHLLSNKKKNDTFLIPVSKDIL